MAIQASEKQLNQIFNLTNYQFLIPPYQRPYAWTTEQASQLINDFLDAFPYDDEESPNYFLGSIILIKEEGKPKAEVIDGQQRLTTLTLLLSVFRYLLPENHPSHQIISHFLEGTDVTGTEKIYGLKLRSQDDPFFGDKVRNSDGMKILLTQNVGLDTDSQMLLRDNASLLTKELTERCPKNTSMEEWILYLFKNILNKCYLVTVSTSDFDVAYRIFSTINTQRAC